MWKYMYKLQANNYENSAQNEGTSHTVTRLEWNSKAGN